jgi:hypothetical protein
MEQWQGNAINYGNKVGLDEIFTIEGNLKIGIICTQSP